MNNVIKEAIIGIIDFLGFVSDNLNNDYQYIYELSFEDDFNDDIKDFIFHLKDTLNLVKDINTSHIENNFKFDNILNILNSIKFVLESLNNFNGLDLNLVKSISAEILNQYLIKWIASVTPLLYNILLLFDIVLYPATRRVQITNNKYSELTGKPQLNLAQLFKIIKNPREFLVEKFTNIKNVDIYFSTEENFLPIKTIFSNLGFYSEFISIKLLGNPTENPALLVKTAFDSSNHLVIGLLKEKILEKGSFILINFPSSFNIGLDRYKIGVSSSLSPVLIEFFEGKTPNLITATNEKEKLKFSLDITQIESKELFVGEDEIGTKFILNDPKFTIEFNYQQSRLELTLYFSLKHSKLLVDFSNADSFLKSLGKLVDIIFDLEVGFSNSNGFHFRGTGGLEFKFSGHKKIGPLEILDSNLKIILDEESLSIFAGLEIKTELGALKITIENVGIKGDLDFFSDRPKNLGFVNFDLGFSPPKGVGISLDAHAFRGAGYLFLDYKKGEYAGAIEIEVFGFISLKAIGIITTKLPDGQPGFSLLIIITAEFTPIQLGFGFTLNGVGGLLGLNRASRHEAIGNLIRSGNLNNIFFPTNVVANIARIISDIKTVFPEQQGNFVFGPLGKIGWGTPPIVLVELGLILDVPNPFRIAIIGTARVDLPGDITDKPAIIQLRMAFMVAVDFGRKLIAIDASLYDSRILFATISGDFALRIGWGANPMFILSVGGFHPAYREAPVDLQNMKRFTYRSIDTSFLRMGYEAYLAVTSNTVQLGVKGYFFASVYIIEAEAGFEFDALFRFEPEFSFIVSLGFHASLKVNLGFFGRHTLFAIRVFGELSGPERWHFWGYATFKILCFEKTFAVDHTWGDEPSAIPELFIDVLTLLKDEFIKPQNWQGIPMPNSAKGITTKQADAGSKEIVLFPATTLRVSQKLAPLDVTLQKFGEGSIQEGSPNSFSITKFSIGSKQIFPTTEQDGTVSFGNKTNVQEQFAPATFQKLSDEEKLARVSYEPMNSGVELSITDNTDVRELSGGPVSVEINYEINYVNTKEKEIISKRESDNKKQFTDFIKTSQFLRESRGSAAFRSKFSQENNRTSHLAPKGLKRKKGSYVVRDAITGEVFKVPVNNQSQAGAYDYLIKKGQEEPERELQIILQYE